jgi:hypothetical protein
MVLNLVSIAPHDVFGSQGAEFWMLDGSGRVKTPCDKDPVLCRAGSTAAPRRLWHLL